MKEFVLSPPNAVLYIAGAVVLVAIASIFLKKGATIRKVIGVGVSILVVGGILFFVYRPVTIQVSEDGLVVRGAGGLELSWDEVESAVFEENLENSPFRPTVRTRGTAIGPYRTGRFLLSNGNSARVFMVQSNSAVIIRTDDLTYLFAPDDAEALAGAVDRYRVYEEGGSQ